MKFKLIYGKEFWEELENLIGKARKRIFLVSAYIGKKTYNRIKSLFPKGTFHLAICRSDSSYRPADALVVDKNALHGKLYLIDNTVIIGSQNLYNIKKEGEFNVLISSKEESISPFLYQALLKIIEKEKIKAEPVHESFLNFYSFACPFCGNATLPDPFTIYSCPIYDRPGFVSDEDCRSFGGLGGCKHCVPEYRKPLGECYVCDSVGCGFGINSEDFSLVYHAIDAPEEELVFKAKEFLRLFNFVAKKQKNVIEIFKNLGLIGRVYDTMIKRDELQFINKHFLKNF